MGTGPGQGTFPIGINPNGAVTGGYVDANNVNHGFVHAPDGAIATFDVPGAGTGPFQGTSVDADGGINPAGAICETYLDASNVLHGFVRARDGAITTIDVPGAGTGLGQGTVTQSINPPGAIVALYIDANNVSHGLLVERVEGE